ncbi:transcription factor HES-5-like protein [Labeo rohita]|uniref:Transcription factor HES-5-like protein n=1 Tax=Labeo rohita TaxID=84645 RepID=A0A498NXC0_LABRO|nr:transcription factor HES-5-like protein [Labeo rohita]RXN36872.1 transcription factor HES-5-like protein [Labeo rohita]
MTPTIISKEILLLNNKVCSHPTYSSITAAAFRALLNCWFMQRPLSDAFLSSFADEKTIFGKDAQRSYQLKLKCLLAPEFLKQQPDSKLEKAEILEMMLNFMQCHNFTSHAVNSGFSMCEQNRRESVLPDQKTFSKDMNVNKSAI